MRHRYIRSSALRTVAYPQSGLVIALTSLKADPRACISNPFILAELERLDFIQQSPWANAITLKGEAFLNGLATHLPRRPSGFYRQAELRA